MVESSETASSDTDAEGKGDAPAKPRRRWLRYTLWGMPLFAAAAMFVTGIVFWGGFNTAMEATNTLGFCISCHEMEETVYQEYKKTVHYQNRTGVRATCSDCHVPDPWIDPYRNPSCWFWPRRASASAWRASRRQSSSWAVA